MNWYYYVAFGLVGFVVLVIMLERFKLIQVNIPMAPKDYSHLFERFKTSSRQEYYRNTNQVERIIDESSKDPIAESPGDWQRNILSKDYPGIDTPLPPGIKIDKSYVDDSDFKAYGIMRYEYYMTKDGDPVGYIQFRDSPKERLVHVSFGEIFPKYRGKGYYQYLRRELVNFADEKRHTIETTPVKNDIPYEKLKEYYASFSDPRKVEIEDFTDDFDRSNPRTDHIIYRKPNN